jgi:hypothetical protein
MWILIAAEAMASAPSLKVRHREQPTYPLVSPPPPIDLRCLVTVSIQVDGRAKKAVVDDPCPEPFAEATRQAAMGYRWKPVRVDGKRVTAQTKIAMIFQWDEPPLPEAPAVDGFALPEYRRRGELGSGGGDAAPWPSTGPYEPVAYAGPLGEHHGMWTPRSAEPGPAVVWLGGRRYGEDQDVPAPFHEAGVGDDDPGAARGAGQPRDPRVWARRGRRRALRDPLARRAAGDRSPADLCRRPRLGRHARVAGRREHGGDPRRRGRRARGGPGGGRLPGPSGGLGAGVGGAHTAAVDRRRGGPHLDHRGSSRSQPGVRLSAPAPAARGRARVLVAPRRREHFTVVGPALRAAATAIVADTGASPALQVVWPDL